MSEPVQKGDIDLSALDQALSDPVSKSVPEILQAQSSTLSQPATESPATLSPSSPRSLSPRPDETHVGNHDRAALVGTAELKGMFPELDTETISAVLSSRGGDQEAAVNALLQMSDPNFKPAKHETQADTDALLAQSIAMDEQQKHLEQIAKHQQRSSAGRGGGGAASFFDGILGSSKLSAGSTPSPGYDPNVLTYQPRVRKPMQTPTARASASPGPHPATSSGSTYEDSLIQGLPGAKDARQWQEGINKMAETGLARAASTFTSLKQKANAAFNAPAGTANDGVTSEKSAAFQGFQQAKPSYATGSNAPAAPRGLRSPRSPNASEYDRDPSPVSDNELAKIISGGSGSARGGLGPGRGSEMGQGTGNKAKTLADRYGLGIKKSGASAVTKTGDTSNYTDTDLVYQGWDQAGRTPALKTAIPSTSTGQDTIALMDSAQGRGLSSPRKEQSPARRDVAQTVNTTTQRSSIEHNDDNDSDDLEYVSNPFEEED